MDGVLTRTGISVFIIMYRMPGRKCILFFPFFQSAPPPQTTDLSLAALPAEMKGRVTRMKKVNYHTHTKLCLHAEGMEQDYVLAALNAGLDVLGFSDHAPFPDDRLDLRMRYEELDGHLTRIAGLKSKYQNHLTILTGLEIEYLRDQKDYYEFLLKEKQLDYLLLGQHCFPASDGTVLNSFSISPATGTSGYKDYARSVREALETGYFRILAHPDLIFINDLPWDENCEEACDIIVSAARDTGTILELNANGIRKNIRNYQDMIRYPYPHPRFWERVSGTGLPVVINSDCHNPDFLWDSCMERARQLAQEWNLHLVDSLD